MLSSSEVQQLLGVADYDIIAYGYTFERHTLEVYFVDGKCIREETPYQKESTSKEFDQFDGEAILEENVKRWYDSRTNAKLVELCKTFGRELSITKG